MRAGDRIDRFTVVEQLGAGGMAAVYGVRHTTLDTPHALKVLTLHGQAVSDRLIQEGKVQAKLAHPNVVAVTDVLMVDGAPGLLMEYISGPPMDEWLAHHQPDLDEALTVFRGILAGVAHAHDVGLVHRDLKPGNVMLAVSPAGHVTPKVMDFGLAKSFRKASPVQTRSGAIMGTPAYMPPEQVRDASSVDRRADIYALGCILYELVCHTRPFHGNDIEALLTDVMKGACIPAATRMPGLPRAVIEAIEGMMVTERRFRISDCAAVLEVLHGVSTLNSLTEARQVPTAEGLPAPRPFHTDEPTSLAPALPGAAVAARLVRPPMPSVRTVAAAAARVQRPPTEQGPPSELESTEPSRRLLPAVFTGVFAVVVFSVVMFAGGLLAVALFAILGPTSGPRVVEPAVDPVPVEGPKPSEPRPSEPVVPEPTEEPEPSEPEPSEPEPSEPAPHVRPTAPLPTPPPSPPPQPEPPGPVLSASILVAPDPAILTVRLSGPGGDHVPGAMLAPGKYTVSLSTAEFQNAGAGSFEVAAEETLRLKCSPSSGRCSRE